MTAPEHGWTSAQTLAGFAIVAALLAAFVTLEQRVRHPLVRLGIFKSGSLVRANLGAVGVFGSYVEEHLERCLRRGDAAFRYRHHTARAIRCRVDSYGAELILADGSGVRADRVVLALGNPPPRTLPALASSSLAAGREYFTSAWSDGALARPERDLPVLLIGSGLTAVDALLAITSTGYTGSF